MRSTGRSRWEEAEALRRKAFRQVSLESWVLSAVTRGALRIRSARLNSCDSQSALALIPRDAPACAPTCLQPIVYNMSSRSNAGWVREVETSKAITLSEHPRLPNHRHRNHCPKVQELGWPYAWESSCEWMVIFNRRQNMQWIRKVILAEQLDLNDAARSVVANLRELCRGLTKTERVRVWGYYEK